MSPRCRTSTSPTRIWPRSTGTQSTPGSTSGSSRATRDKARGMTQAQAEARELSRIATEELSSLPRGIHDIQGAIARRVFRTLGAPAAPVRLMHDAISRGTFESVRGGMKLTVGAAGVAARGRTGDVPLSETPRGAAVIAALNGLVGDRLEADGSPLAVPMSA